MLNAGESVLSLIRELRRDESLIPFVGAGLSIPLGLPSWDDVLDIIARQLGYTPDVFKLNGDSLQLAEYYVAMKGSIGPLRSEMDRLFNPTDEQILASRAHNALVDMRLPLLYTTNYDRIIERAYALRDCLCFAVFRTSDKSRWLPERSRTWSSFTERSATMPVWS